MLRSSEMIANNKSANRDAERTFIADRDKALTVSGSVFVAAGRLTFVCVSQAGEPWQRVTFFCDLQLKGEEGRVDTSRLKELLIQLKH